MGYALLNGPVSAIYAERFALYAGVFLDLYMSLGVVGYALLSVSAALDICGVLDTQGSGGLLYVHGFIFEMILLPLWLIFRGFRPAAAKA